MNTLMDINGLPSSTSAPARYPRSGIHGTIVHAIGGDIVNGALQQGQRLPSDQEMMARFQASRTALREAMKVLSSKGLIESRQRAGTRVRPRSDWDLLDVDVLSWHRPESISESFTADLVELRELIEPVAAKLAADRATSDDLTRIEAAYLRMETSVDDYEGFYMADVDFHLAVLNASHNQLVQRLAGIIGTVLGLSFSLQKTVRIPLRESLESHYQVFDGIRQRNRRSAERAMRITIRRGRNTLSQQRKAVRDQAFQAP
ncbi:MAG: FadR family transcriptional regulator [Rhodospirillaceae bacterium]|jgi:GntR family transcriptional regulator, galactonate operon transcriptional repressor|nr:FadR family transcriptional regulator [Rhodospirillaceae bacterium]MBT4485926.1 FadR family transcriptional regulator [Rhodospirillaceae bacterium]MBT5898137.1 FadR family transcriptional regulator [Rhodospirillaceae bacterium]MBT6428516.1 FadR family transcriptional regulator [Rhodospirillaceae bacterium]MBT7667546.1 FadR family transcriptional regulator [Rhodospirillaceae bacterium]